MSTVSADPLILPVARYLGERYDGEAETSTYEFRRGWQVIRVSARERDTWALAHGLTNRVRLGVRWTRAALLQTVNEGERTEAEAALERLLDLGMLVEIDPGTEAAVDFARSALIVPLQLGAGNSAEKPWAWRIGSPIGIIEVSEVVYHVWEWCHLHANLWECCQRLAAANAEHYENPEEAEDCDPRAILDEVLLALHQVLSSTAAYIDTPAGVTADAAVPASVTAADRPEADA